jgi:hypothetical protein
MPWLIHRNRHTLIATQFGGISSGFEPHAALLEKKKKRKNQMLNKIGLVPLLCNPSTFTMSKHGHPANENMSQALLN